MKLAIFDLDNTLLNGDSDFAWGQFLVTNNVVDRDYYEQENERFYQQYQSKTLDIHEYQAFVLAPIKTMTTERFAELHKIYMDTVVNDLRLHKADALIADHKAAGDELLIITATNGLIAGPIGPWLGIDNILTTDAEVVDGQLTGKIAGTPCFQEGKITRLNQWLAEQQAQYDEMYFYSDSINDLPLLQTVDHPIVVDPDDRLGAHAETVGWKALSLR